MAAALFRVLLSDGIATWLMPPEELLIEVQVPVACE